MRLSPDTDRILFPPDEGLIAGIDSCQPWNITEDHRMRVHESQVWPGLRMCTALGLVCALTACSTAPQLESMVPAPAASAYPSAGRTLTISPQGQDNQISYSDFRGALIRAIDQSGLFASIDADEAGYELIPTIMRVEKGLPINVRIRYLLRDRATEETLMDATLQSSGSAGLGDSVWGWRRIRLATEKAVRNNIIQLIIRIADLDLANRG